MRVIAGALPLEHLGAAVREEEYNLVEVAIVRHFLETLRVVAKERLRLAGIDYELVFLGPAAGPRTPRRILDALDERHPEVDDYGTRPALHRPWLVEQEAERIVLPVIGIAKPHAVGLLRHVVEQRGVLDLREAFETAHVTLSNRCM